MERKNQADKSLFKIPENQENFQLLYKLLSEPSKGLCLCQVPPPERLKMLEFFEHNPLVERIHIVDMVKPLRSPMELQQFIISVDKKGTKDIFFIYNIEECIRLLKTTGDDFFQGMNLIRDFFMHFEAAFVFWVTESSVKKMIRNAFDFYDWMQFTFTFVPEDKDFFLPPVESGEVETKKYSNLHKKINYLKQSLKKVKNEKAKSMRLLDLGKLYVQVGDYDSALEQFTQSLEIEEKHQDLNNMAMLYREIGLSHNAKGELDKALLFFNKAMTIFEKNNDRANIDQVRTSMDKISQLKEDKKDATGNIKPAGALDNHDFPWEELLERIKRGEIIPVIGQGLYRATIDPESKREVLLYDYLAHQVAKACGMALNPEENHKFAKACASFLRKKAARELSDLLKKRLEGLRPVPSDSLWKLVRIKAFNMFITTTYDDFLTKILKTVRGVPIRVVSYSRNYKEWRNLDADLLESIESSRSALVYHFFGNMGKTFASAYTENEMLENLVEFQKDITRHIDNILIQKLEGSSFLFIGCGFDDWLYRFFIRIIANKPFNSPFREYTGIYMADDFYHNKKDPFQELPRFLSDYGIGLFHTDNGEDFVDILFDKLEKVSPEEIIHPVDFPGTAFISFDGKDRGVAQLLARHLRDDGIAVWMDVRNLKPGDQIDLTIIKAIDQCSVFIPLISKNSRQLLSADENLKFHAREWEWAYSNKLRGADVTILPVNIDGTGWTHGHFKDFLYLNIPGGRRDGEYEKLRDQLIDVQHRAQG